MDIILYYKEAFNIAQEDLEEISKIDLDHLNLYARHMLYLQVDYNAGIINGESIEKALEVAVISKAKDYYKRLVKNRKKRIVNEKIRDETSNPTDIERLTEHQLKKYMTTLKEDDLDKYMENWNENYCINSITLVEEFPRPEIMAYAMKKEFFKDDEIEEIMKGGIDLNSEYRQNVLSNFYDFYYKEDLLKRLREELLDPVEY
ncbi:hypothetical protein JW949_03650 [Candidatus Woesearchaeota archaeon]|nr:hypothetical protein [Candidatus Woesearchaeota archaeon]